MNKYDKTEFSFWQREPGTQLRVAPRSETEMETGVEEKSGRDAATWACIGNSSKASALIIPIRWVPPESWSKTLRIGKSLPE